jgi:hypothetical protein
MAPGAFPTRLNATEVRTLVANNTMISTAGNGRPTYYYLVRDGRLKYQQDNFADGGSWRVSPEGLLCTTLTRIDAGVENCYTVDRDGSNFRIGRPDGAPVAGFTVFPGNRQNL